MNNNQNIVAADELIVRLMELAMGVGLEVPAQEQVAPEQPAVGARRRQRRPTARRSRIRGGLDADDMEQWGIGRRRRGGAQRLRRVGGAGGAPGFAVEVPNFQYVAAAAAGGPAGAGEGGVGVIAAGLVPIVDLAGAVDGSDGSAGSSAGDGQEICCIGACCQEKPVYTWLRCCRNEEACVDCVTEHIRRRGWRCPMCRGDLRA